MSNHSNLLSRIAIDTSNYQRKPCIKGHQIGVASILSNLAEGMTVKDILDQYPQLQREDILACFAYGAEMTQDITEVVGKIVIIQQGGILEFESRERE